MQEPVEPALRPLTLEYAVPPAPHARDGTNAFATAKFLTMTVLWTTFMVAGLLSGDNDSPGLVVCGAPLVSGVFAIIAVPVLNVTLATLGAAGCRRTVGSRRTFAVAGCASVVATVTAMAALGFLIDSLHLNMNGASAEASAAVAITMLLVPTLGADVASGFVLARWGRVRPIAP